MLDCPGMNKKESSTSAPVLLSFSLRDANSFKKMECQRDVFKVHLRRIAPPKKLANWHFRRDM